MDIIQGKVLEVSHDYENVFHIVIEAQLPDGVAQVRLNASLLGQDPRVNPASRMPNEPFRFIATTTGEPALKVGDFIPIEIFYRDEVIPDPKKPTRVVPMDAFVSPKWAKRELFVEMISKLCIPCKEHGVMPVVSDMHLAKAPNRALGTAHLKVHCPNDQCKYFAEDYNPAEWNALMK
jgi:hypothetical protein